MTNTPTMTNTPSPTPPFNPLTLNPMIWVDFNDRSTLTLRSGQFVESVSNKGNWTAFTGFSQTTAANQPSWSASTMGTGMSAITISTDFLEASQGLTGSSWNTIIVNKHANTTFQFLRIVNQSGTQNYWSNAVFNTARGNSTYKLQGVNEYRAQFNNYTAYTTPHIIQSYMSNSALTIVDYFTVNNSAQTKTILFNSVVSTGAPGNITSPQFRIVNEDSVYFDVDGEIGEMYFFDKELTSTQQTNLINYLKTKWGIS
jgi:hypothetical protein